MKKPHSISLGSLPSNNFAIYLLLLTLLLATQLILLLHSYIPTSPCSISAYTLEDPREQLRELPRNSVHGPELRGQWQLCKAALERLAQQVQ